MFEDQNQQNQTAPGQMTRQPRPQDSASKASPPRGLPTVEDLVKQGTVVTPPGGESSPAPSGPFPEDLPVEPVKGEDFAHPAQNQTPLAEGSELPMPQVEDIFDGADSREEATKGNVSVPRATPGEEAQIITSPLLPQDSISGAKKLRGKKNTIIAVGVLLVAILGVGGYVVYDKFFQTSAGEGESGLLTGQETPLNEPGTPSSIPVTEPEPEPAPENLDSDNDGLTDEEESALGTNPDSLDTDEDRLSDLDEVEVYKTSPLNPDTDGDGYIDGEEVENGYNPNGSGKLSPTPSSEGADSQALFKQEAEAAYRSYLQAVSSKDFETAKKYLPQETLTQLEGVSLEMIEQTFQLLKAWSVEPENLEVVSIELEGEKVIIKARDKSKPEEGEFGATNKGKIILYKAGEQWKVEQESWGSSGAWD